MEKDEKEIDAVHEQDLADVLRKIGSYDDLTEGKLKCKFCGTVITFENLHSILPHENSFSYTCDKPECILLLAEYLEEKNKGKTGQI